MRILTILRLAFFALPLFALISCGYKLGGLEVIGDNQDKVAEVKILSPNNFKQSFINAGFTISSENFLAARALMSAKFVHNIAMTKEARISNLYKDAPKFQSQIDILA